MGTESDRDFGHCSMTMRHSCSKALRTAGLSWFLSRMMFPSANFTCEAVAFSHESSSAMASTALLSPGRLLAFAAETSESFKIAFKTSVSICRHTRRSLKERRICDVGRRALVKAETVRGRRLASTTRSVIRVSKAWRAVAATS